MTQCIDAMKHNGHYKIAVLGEPQLGKCGLYPTITQKGRYNAVEAMVNFIAYADGTSDLFAICERIGVPVRELIRINVCSD